MINFSTAANLPATWYNKAIKEQRRPYGNETSKKMIPLNDFIFQRLFGEEETKDSLIALLNAILQLKGKEKITIVELLSKDLHKKMYREKTGRLDIRAETDNGMQINIEVQLANTGNMVKRSLFYEGKMYVETIYAGEEHENLKKTVAINIMGYNLFKHSSRFHNTFHFYEDYEKDFMLTDVMELHFIELPKFRKLVKDWNNPLHRWLLFLDDKLSKIERKELISMDHDIAKADERLDWLRGDKETRELFTARELAKIELNSQLSYAEKKGKAEGKAEGELHKSEEIVKNMLRKGMETSLIAEVTSMSIEEVKALKEKILGIEK